MFCRKCGKEIDKNSLECSYCGCSVVALENSYISEKKEFSLEETKIESQSPNSNVKLSNKKANRRILFGLFYLLIISTLVFATICFWPPKIITHDINSINGAPEFYDIQFGMDVDEAGKNIALKHRCIEGMNENDLFEVSDFNKTSHIIIEEGEVFSLYKKKTSDVYVSFDEKTVDGVMLSFSKSKHSLASIVTLYEKIYGTPSDKSDLGATWKGKYTTIYVIDWSQVPSDDGEVDNSIVVRYFQTENSKYTFLSFNNSEIDVCGFLDQNYIFDKSPSYFIKDLVEGSDYEVESFLPDGFPGFTQYTLYPRFEYFNIEKGRTAIEFTVPSDSDKIDTFSYLYLLESQEASSKTTEIVNALKEKYGDSDTCYYTSLQYSNLGINSISHSEMIKRISSGTEGIYSIQWKSSKELITFRLTIDLEKTYYQGSVAFSKQ